MLAVAIIVLAVVPGRCCGCLASCCSGLRQELNSAARPDSQAVLGTAQSAALCYQVCQAALQGDDSAAGVRLGVVLTVYCLAPGMDGFYSCSGCCLCRLWALNAIFLPAQHVCWHGVFCLQWAAPRGSNVCTIQMWFVYCCKGVGVSGIAQKFYCSLSEGVVRDNQLTSSSYLLHFYVDMFPVQQKGA